MPIRPMTSRPKGSQLPWPRMPSRPRRARTPSPPKRSRPRSQLPRQMPSRPRRPRMISRAMTSRPTTSRPCTASGCDWYELAARTLDEFEVAEKILRSRLKDKTFAEFKMKRGDKGWTYELFEVRWDTGKLWLPKGRRSVLPEEAKARVRLSAYSFSFVAGRLCTGGHAQEWAPARRFYPTQVLVGRLTRRPTCAKKRFGLRSSEASLSLTLPQHHDGLVFCRDLVFNPRRASRNSAGLEGPGGVWCRSRLLSPGPQSVSLEGSAVGVQVVVGSGLFGL